MTSSRPLRVLLLTDADAFAGTERHMLDLAQALAGENVQPAISCPVPAPLATRARGAGVRVLPIAKHGLIDWPAIRRLRRALKHREFDLVHAHNGRTALNAALAQLLARRGKVVMTQHFLAPDHAGRGGVKGKVSHAAHHWMGGRLGGTIAISEAVREAAIERGDAPEDLHTILNGIAEPATSQQSRAMTRAQWNVPTDAPLIVCVARLQGEKDIATLLRAMPDVLRAAPDAHCLIAGQGDLQDELEGLRGELGLDARVRLLGFVSDVPALMAAADVFCLPARAEPFGLVLVEAMAARLPVVAAREGGPVEIVEDGVTGSLVPPQDTAALAAALTELVQDPERARAMGELGRLHYKERFTSARMAREIAAFYRSVL